MQIPDVQGTITDVLETVATFVDKLHTQDHQRNAGNVVTNCVKSQKVYMCIELSIFRS